MGDDNWCGIGVYSFYDFCRNCEFIDLCFRVDDRTVSRRSGFKKKKQPQKEMRLAAT